MALNMNPAPERLGTAETLALIAKYARDGVRVLGVEGFVTVPEGYIAYLDLILDVSAPEVSSAEGWATADAFVREKDRPNVLWEVWIDD
jgi:hypothetical protein